MKNKNKNKINSGKKRRARALKKKDPEEYERLKRQEEYLKASIERLNEYAVNIKRDKDDPLWEPGQCK